jgi:hypothetical protein
MRRWCGGGGCCVRVSRLYMYVLPVCDHKTRCASTKCIL